ncbi:MAG: hypothetical protein LLG04_09435 [Parachlamydia sp.]|nr:hypothetical protein [Parachlamydia sp.]
MQSQQVTGKRPRQSSEEDLLLKKRGSETQECDVDYHDAPTLLKTARISLDLLANAGVITHQKGCVWIQQMKEAMHNEDLSMDRKAYKRVIQDVFGHVDQFLEIYQKSQKFSGRSCTPQNLDSAAKTASEIYLDDITTKLQKLKRNASKVQEAVNSGLCQGKLENPAGWLAFLAEFLKERPSVRMDARVQACLQSLVPKWHRELCTLYPEKRKELNREALWLESQCGLLVPNLKKKLESWNKNLIAWLPDLRRFLFHTIHPKTTSCNYLQLLELLGDLYPNIYAEKQIRTGLQQLVMNLWPIVKQSVTQPRVSLVSGCNTVTNHVVMAQSDVHRNVVKPCELFEEFAAGIRLLQLCKAPNLFSTSEIQFHDGQSLRLNEEATEAIASISKPFAKMLPSKIRLPFSQEQFQHFYLRLTGKELIDFTGVQSDLALADYFGMDAFIDECFDQLQETLVGRDCVEGMQKLCQLQESLSKQHYRNKWEQARDQTISELLKEREEREDKSSSQLHTFSTLLEKSRSSTQPWPRTLHLSWHRTALLQRFNFRDVEVIRLSHFSHFRDENYLPLIEGAQKIKELDYRDNDLNLTRLSQHCPILERLVCASSCLQSLNGFVMQNLTHLEIAGTLGDELASPFGETFPKLGTFKFEASWNHLFVCEVCYSEKSIRIEANKYFHVSNQFIDQNHAFVADLLGKFPFLRVLHFHHKPGANAVSYRLFPDYNGQGVKVVSFTNENAV